MTQIIRAKPKSSGSKLVRRLGFGLGVLALLGLGLGITTMLTKVWTSPQASISVGGPFSLIDENGHPITDRDFRGKWMLVYFGYTHCPDACPTALSHIANALDQLGPAAAAKIAPIFITVDPARDTPQVMREYVAAFGPGIRGLSGSAAQIAAAETQYRVYAAKHPEKNGGYSMDHSSIVYVMNPDGEFVASFTHETTVAAMVAKLRALGA